MPHKLRKQSLSDKYRQSTQQSHSLPERERQTDRHRETETDSERHKEIDTDRKCVCVCERERERERERDRRRQRASVRERERETYKSSKFQNAQTVAYIPTRGKQSWPLTLTSVSCSLSSCNSGLARRNGIKSPNKSRARLINVRQRATVMRCQSFSVCKQKRHIRIYTIYMYIYTYIHTYIYMYTMMIMSHCTEHR